MVVLAASTKIRANSDMASRRRHGRLASGESQHRFWRFRVDLLDPLSRARSRTSPVDLHHHLRGFLSRRRGGSSSALCEGPDSRHASVKFCGFVRFLFFDVSVAMSISAGSVATEPVAL